MLAKSKRPRPKTHYLHMNYSVRCHCRKQSKQCHDCWWHVDWEMTNLIEHGIFDTSRAHFMPKVNGIVHQNAEQSQNSRTWWCGRTIEQKHVRIQRCEQCMGLILGKAFFNHRDTQWNEQIQHCSVINREIHVVQVMEMISTYLHTRTQLITSEKYWHPSSSSWKSTWIVRTYRKIRNLR